MGTQKVLTLGTQRFKPEELSALVLRQLLEDARRYLGEDVEEAVISVPAYFNDDQRCATKLAAQLAGLTVKRLINEPSAAALYHRYSTQSGDSQMMIVDFGGGTLDVSIVALGVGLCAGIKERAEDLQDLVMTDVCPFSLGVATYSYRGDKTPHMAVLIPRSSMLPASHQGTFCTMYDNQRALRFEIYQGEGYFASENLKLGEVEVQVPPGPSGEQSATVTFTYDIDGILHVSARSSGGDQRDRLILNPNLHLSEAEREKVMARISEIQLAAQGSQKEQLLLERALRLGTPSMV